MEKTFRTADMGEDTWRKAKMLAVLWNISVGQVLELSIQCLFHDRRQEVDTFIWGEVKHEELHRERAPGVLE